MAALSIRNVWKWFPNGTTALKGINFDVEDGQFLILVGGSGCGKTTLLNIIAGLETATKGEVLFDGKVVNELPPRHRDVAMVFQSYALYPSMTVRENIAFGLRIRKVPPAEQQATVKRVSEMLQIDHLLDRKPSQLSGGQRQRVAMGRALARDPVMFLFDEPLSNLDAQLRVEMRGEIKLLHQRLGTTICYVTHDQIEAMTMGDRIAVMNDGVVQQFGTPKEVYEQPANLFVAGFIGAPPMNRISGKLVELCSGIGFELASAVERITLRLPRAPSCVRDHLGRQVILGLRPERITNAESRTVREDGPAPSILAKVEVVELTGPDTLLFTEMNGTRVISRVHASLEPRPGEALRLHLDTTAAILFDPADGKRLT